MNHLASFFQDEQFWRLVAVVVFVIAIYFGTLEMARAIFRVGEGRRQRQLAAIEFAIANYDALVDNREHVITRNSLLISKFRADPQTSEHVQTLIDKMNVYGHVIRGSTSSTYVWGYSRDDLNRAKNALG